MPLISCGPAIPQNDTEAAYSSVGEGYVFFLGQRLALVVGVSDDEDHGDSQSDQQHTDRVDHHPLADERRILLFTTQQTHTRHRRIVISIIRITVTSPRRRCTAMVSCTNNQKTPTRVTTQVTEANLRIFSRKFRHYKSQIIMTYCSTIYGLLTRI